MTADPVPAYRGEAMLLRWGHTSTSGFTVSFTLHDDDCAGRPPFEGFAAGKGGQRFLLVAVPIADSEEPAPPRDLTAAMREAEADFRREFIDTSGAFNALGEPRVRRAEATQPPARPRRHLSEMSPSQQAALRLRDERFLEWLLDMPTGAGVCAADRELAEQMLKRRLGIASKRDLDADTPEARAKAEAWRRLETQFLAETGGMAEARR